MINKYQDVTTAILVLFFGNKSLSFLNTKRCQSAYFLNIFPAINPLCFDPKLGYFILKYISRIEVAEGEHL